MLCSWGERERGMRGVGKENVWMRGRVERYDDREGERKKRRQKDEMAR